MKNSIKISEQKKNNFRKLKLIQKFSYILKRNDFSYNFENSTFIFKNKINNNKTFLNVKKLCYFFDCQFKIISNNKIELIY